MILLAIICLLISALLITVVGYLFVLDKKIKKIQDKANNCKVNKIEWNQILPR